jgi:hypothetical protein
LRKAYDVDIGNEKPTHNELVFLFFNGKIIQKEGRIRKKENLTSRNLIL